MKTLTRDQKRKAFDLMMKEKRGAKDIVAARRTNSAPDYDSAALVERAKKTADKRVKTLVQATKSFAENEKK